LSGCPTAARRFRCWSELQVRQLRLAKVAGELLTREQLAEVLLLHITDVLARQSGLVLGDTVASSDQRT
jgi:hypothetical protein